MKILKFHIILLIIILVSNCLEPFDPNIQENDVQFFVVDGAITDQPGPYTILISKSATLNNEITPVSDLEVIIEEENGVSETLYENSPGVYQTSIIRGKTGKRYRLILNHPDHQIQSSWETLIGSPSLDSLYFRVETKETNDVNIELDGIQFYVDSEGTSGEARHLRFEWDETWRIGVSWPISYDYIGHDMFQNTSKKLNLVCWKHDSNIGINLVTTEGLTHNVLAYHKLGFITGENDRFTKRYSILIKQFGISKKEYSYWQILKESNIELGGLFDEQPNNLIGNLSDLSSPSTPVLGYFSASGLQEKRIYIRPDQVPDVLSNQIKCPLDSILKTNDPGGYTRELFTRLNEGALFYDLIYSNDGQAPLGVLLSTLECSDCVENQGSIEKPEFWDE